MVGRSPGGIGGLLNLPRETWEAIEADLFRVGFFLHDIPHKVSWRVIRNMVRYAQRGSAVFLAQTGEAGQFSQTDTLLALIFDELRAANWQRSGGQGDFPTPFPRPGMNEERASGPVRPTQEGVQYFGSDAISTDDWSSWWDEKEAEVASQ